MNKLWKLENTIQSYAWGDPVYLADLLGLDEKQTPRAEMWMGAHPGAPSQISELNTDLFSFIEKNRSFVLGDGNAAQYANLPFLFKVLTAGKALSIQVHPSKKQAETGFFAENNKNIALDAFNRTYKDDNHKPEILCALTPFTAMKGFRQVKDIVRFWADAGLSGTVVFLDKSLADGDLKSFSIGLLSLGEVEKLLLLKTAAKISESKVHSLEAEWVLKLMDMYPGDIAALAPLYLNLYVLKAGQAVYLKAGIMHAYLEGAGIELMANSDNVIRGGLTPKYIDLEEMADVVIFESDEGGVLSSKAGNNEWFVYKTPFREFELSSLKVDGQAFSQRDEGPQIILCTEGSVTVSSGTESIVMRKGESLIVFASASELSISGKASLYRAGVPSEV